MSWNIRGWREQTSWSISQPPRQTAQLQRFIPEHNYYQPPQLHQATQNLRHVKPDQPSKQVTQSHSFWPQQSFTGQPPQQATQTQTFSPQYIVANQLPQQAIQPQNAGSQLLFYKYTSLSLASDRQSTHHWDDTHTSNSRHTLKHSDGHQ